MLHSRQGETEAITKGKHNIASSQGSGMAPGVYDVEYPRGNGCSVLRVEIRVGLEKL